MTDDSRDPYEPYLQNPTKFAPGGLIIRRRNGMSVVVVVKKPCTFQIQYEKSHSNAEGKLRFIGEKGDFVAVREELYFTEKEKYAPQT